MSSKFGISCFNISNPSVDHGQIVAETAKANSNNTVPIGSNLQQASEQEYSSQDGGNKNKHTEEYLKEFFKNIFDKEKYGVEYDINIIIRISVKADTKEDLLSLYDADLEEIKECLERAFEKHKKIVNNKVDLNAAIETAKKYNTALASGWTLEEFEQAQADKNRTERNLKDVVIAAGKKKDENFDITKASRDELKSYVKAYFEDKLANYKAQNSEVESEKLLIKDFGLLLANTADADKDILLPIVLEVINDIKPLKLFFASFGDKELAINVADNNIPYVLGDNNVDKQIVVMSNMSKAGIEKIAKIVKERDSEFYNQNSEAIELLLKKDSAKYDANDLALLTKLEKKSRFLAGYTVAVNLNRNISKDDKVVITSDITSFTKENQTYGLYLEALANTLYKNPNPELDIPREEIKKLLDEITDNKFSEVVDNMPNLSATDSETGSFKTPSNQEFEEKIDYLSYLTQQTLNSAQKDESQLFVIVSDSNENESDKTLIPLLNAKIYNVSQILDIITGKKSNATKAEENEAIESYKLLNTAIQGNLLRSASGKFFSKLLENTKTLTLKLLLATGWKANSFAETQKVRETIEERNQESA